MFSEKKEEFDHSLQRFNNYLQEWTLKETYRELQKLTAKCGEAVDQLDILDAKQHVPVYIVKAYPQDDRHKSFVLGISSSRKNAYWWNDKSKKSDNAEWYFGVDSTDTSTLTDNQLSQVDVKFVFNRSVCIKHRIRKI